MFHAFQPRLRQIPDIVNGWSRFNLRFEDVVGTVPPDKGFAWSYVLYRLLGAMITSSVTPKLGKIVLKVRSRWLENVKALLKRLLGIEELHMLSQYRPIFKTIRSFSRSFIIKLSILLIE